MRILRAAGSVSASPDDAAKAASTIAEVNATTETLAERHRPDLGDRPVAVAGFKRAGGVVISRRRRRLFVSLNHDVDDEGACGSWAGVFSKFLNFFHHAKAGGVIGFVAEANAKLARFKPNF